MHYSISVCMQLHNIFMFAFFFFFLCVLHYFFFSFVNLFRLKLPGTLLFLVLQTLEGLLTAPLAGARAESSCQVVLTASIVEVSPLTQTASER